MSLFNWDICSWLAHGSLYRIVTDIHSFIYSLPPFIYSLPPVIHSFPPFIVLSFIHSLIPCIQTSSLFINSFIHYHHSSSSTIQLSFIRFFIHSFIHFTPSFIPSIHTRHLFIHPHHIIYSFINFHHSFIPILHSFINSHH